MAFAFMCVSCVYLFLRVTARVPHLVRAAVCFQPRCSQTPGNTIKSELHGSSTHTQPRPQIACCTSTTGRPSNHLSMLPCIVLRPYGRVGRQLTADHPPVSELLSCLADLVKPVSTSRRSSKENLEGRTRRSCNVRVCVACFLPTRRQGLLCW